MKKTQHEKHPQFIRERNSNLYTPGIDSKNLGTINGKNSRNSRRKQKKFQQLLLIIASLLIITTIAIVYAVQSGKPNNKNSQISSSMDSTIDFSSVMESSNLSDSINFSIGITSGSGSDSSSLASVDRVAAFTALREEVTEYAGNFNGRIGVYYINLLTGESWGLNEKAPFVAASSIKLGINTLLYKNIAEGAFKFTDMLTYDNRAYPLGDMEPGTGSIIGQPNGTQFSVRRTSQLSITISDNCATNMVIRKLGGIDTVVPYLTGISGEVPYRTSISYTDYKGAIMTGRHRTSAKDLGLYAKNLYQLWKTSPKDYQPLIDDLESTVFTFGIQAKLPSEVKVAHKIGTNGDYKTENDAGIVFAKEPYVLCVTTENSSQNAGREAVAEISLKVYNYITEVSK